MRVVRGRRRRDEVETTLGLDDSRRDGAGAQGPWSGAGMTGDCRLGVTRHIVQRTRSMGIRDWFAGRERGSGSREGARGSLPPELRRYVVERGSVAGDRLL